jgi:hypothetical protein
VAGAVERPRRVDRGEFPPLSYPRDEFLNPLKTFPHFAEEIAELYLATLF